jgi:hypothetical protein
MAEKTLKFPHRRSIGTLYLASKDQPEEWQLLTQVRGLVVTPENQPIKWEWLEEARGTLKVPENLKVKLKISTREASLSALETLAENDLHALDLSHSKVTDASLGHLSRLSGLKVLELASTCIGDDGLSAVSALSNLQSLGLSHSRIASSGLAHLKGLKMLREIWFSDTAVDDSGLQFFEEMPLLVQLGMSSTRVTDQGLSHLAGLKNLLRVYLFNTRVTHNGTQMLRRLIPGCRVKWHPTKIHTQDAEDAEFKASAKGDGSFKARDVCAEGTFFLNEEKFWEILGLLDWQKSGDDAGVTEPAVEALAQMSVEQICGFAERLAQMLYLLDGEAYASQIGTDSYKGAKGNFSKNWFLYVRCCVLATGRDFYQEVLLNPEQMPKDMEFQALLSIASKAYKRKTSQRFNYVTKYNYETFSNKQLWGRP